MLLPARAAPTCVSENVHSRCLFSVMLAVVPGESFFVTAFPSVRRFELASGAIHTRAVSPNDATVGETSVMLRRGEPELRAASTKKSDRTGRRTFAPLEPRDPAKEVINARSEE